MELTIGRARKSSQRRFGMIYTKKTQYIDTYTTTLTSRRPLQYFPDDYNGSISAFGKVSDKKLKEEIQKWNSDYYDLLEYRKNPTLGRMKCSKCLLSGSNDDPVFIGIEKVFSRIISNQCNNNATNNHSHEIITYHCNVMNIFSCPFESVESYKNTDKKDETSKYPYKREDLFALHQISFATEQAISTFFEITKNNEIIFEVDFLNDRVHEIHTKYNGEPESWGWQENVTKQLSKVKPISNIVIRDEQDLYKILTNREKLVSLLQEYEKHYQLDKESEEPENEIFNKNLKEELKKHEQEQLKLLKENKQTIVKLLLENKDYIIMEDLKAYEPIYKCYCEKGQCLYCNKLSNIICNNCNGNVCLCVNHWQNHKIEKH